MMSTKWKKRILALGVIAIGLAILSTGTMAYTVVEDTSYNVIISGYVNMALVEEDAEGNPWPGGGTLAVVPGTEVDKRVYAKNRGNVPVYVRVKMDMVLTGADGIQRPIDPAYITLDLAENRWIESDGYYYYYRSLRADESSVPLFTSVKFAPEMGGQYTGCQLEIRLTGQAVQSANNGADPVAALGWPMLAETRSEE